MCDNIQKDFAGKGPNYAFSDAEIKVRIPDAFTLDELIARE